MAWSSFSRVSYERPAEAVGGDENGKQKLHTGAVALAGDQALGHIVDLKLGHVRQLSSPSEVIEFESKRRKGMCVAVGG